MLFLTFAISAITCLTLLDLQTQIRGRVQRIAVYGHYFVAEARHVSFCEGEYIVVFGDTPNIESFDSVRNIFQRGSVYIDAVEPLFVMGSQEGFSPSGFGGSIKANCWINGIVLPHWNVNKGMQIDFEIIGRRVAVIYPDWANRPHCLYVEHSRRQGSFDFQGTLCDFDLIDAYEGPLNSDQRFVGQPRLVNSCSQNNPGDDCIESNPTERFSINAIGFGGFACCLILISLVSLEKFDQQIEGSVWWSTILWTTGFVGGAMLAFALVFSVHGRLYITKISQYPPYVVSKANTLA
jgi:hypothetical protein